MAFYDRDIESKDLKIIIESKPDLVNFVYGPINSGKTTLLMNVLNNLAEDMVYFYINFRGRDINTSGDFLNQLFEVDRKSSLENRKEYLKELGKTGSELIKKYTGIPIPVKVFDLLFKSQDKGEDAFKYLEEFCRSLVEEKKIKPVLVLDEIQVIREITNGSGKPLLEKLFNFMVRMTKETHLCQCVASTSDCLFIEEITVNARLEGRSKYFLVDDLDKEKAMSVYQKMGFQDQETVWDYIGGKIGDMVRLEKELLLGLKEKDAVEEMLKIQTAKLKRMIRSMEVAPPKLNAKEGSIEVDRKEVVKLLKQFAEKCEIEQDIIPEIPLRFLIESNILYLSPLNERITCQSRIIEKAVKNLNLL